MLGFTAPLSIWGRFEVEFYSSWGPAEPVWISVILVPGPVGSTGDDIQAKILEVVFYRLKKNPDYLLLVFSNLTGLHYRLGICHSLQHWCRILFYPRGGRIRWHTFFSSILRPYVVPWRWWGS